MFRKVLRKSKPSAQLFFSAIVLIVCGLVITALGMGIGGVIFGVNMGELEHMMQDLSNPQNVVVLKFFQTIQSIGVFIVPPIVVAWMLDGKPSVYLRYNRLPHLTGIIVVIAIIFFSNPLINWLNEINSALRLPGWLHSVQSWMENSEDQASKITEAFLAGSTISSLFKNIVIIAVLPAIGEELLFRGIVQKLLKKMYGNSHIAIWISAVLFSALHLQFFGFLPRMILGAMFGYMLEWSGTLWLPIIGHFVNNATAVIAWYLNKRGTIGTSLEKTGTQADGSFYLVLVSLIFLFVFFRYLYLRREIDSQTGPGPG